jgi:DHA2 family lincomycin resistance protein-like MFS transporter
MGMITTPAITNGLNALPPQLYSHGSNATVATLQQVAGAAGSALLIAAMSLHAGALGSSGVDALHAELGGIQATFWVSAMSAATAIVLSLLVTRAVTFGRNVAPPGIGSNEPAAARGEGKP